jgi:tetratricopeptide (TPR) repeat protein
MQGVLAGPGTVLAGRYTLERELGRGGSATVHLANDLRHHRLVAVKILRPEIAASLGTERFLREIEIAAHLTHPHILPLYDSGEADGLVYYVMPYVDGESLRDRICQGPLPLVEALQIAREVADALAYAHQRGLVHRDIKPGNILLEAHHAVVSDFGIARAIVEAAGHEITTAGLVVGTPLYMSPEQASGGPVDERSDIYSLGCVLYEMLAGQPPFTGPTPLAVAACHLSDPPPPIRTLQPSVPAVVERAVFTALEKLPSDRFQTAEEVALALTADVRPALRRLQRSISRGRLVAIGLAAVVLVLTGVMAARGRSAVPSSSQVGIVLIPFESTVPTADSPSSARHAPHMILGEALQWLPGVRPLDGSRVLGTVSEWHMVPLAELLRGARRLGGRYLLAGAIYPADADSGLRVTVDLYAVADGERLMRAEELAAGNRLEGPLARLALESVRALAPREGLAMGSRGALLSATSSAAALGYLMQGQAKFSRGDYDGAAVAFRRAIDADSSCGLAYHRWSVAEIWRHDFAAALSAANAGLDRSGELATRWVHLLQAQRHHALRRGDSAIAAFQRVVLKHPEEIDGWLGLGDVLFHFAGLGRHLSMDAQRALEEVVALDSSFAPIYGHLADLALMRGDAQAARRYLERIPQGDMWRPAREAAVTLWFGKAAARRAVLEQLREGDRPTLSQLVLLLSHGSSRLPLADTIASYLMEPDRTPDDRRRGSEYRLAMLAAMGRWEEGLAIWRAGSPGNEFDPWVLQAYFAGYPVSTVSESMFSSARAIVERARTLDLTVQPSTDLVQAVQALVHRATLEGDSAEVLDLLSRLSAARVVRDSSDPLPQALATSLQARLALLADDTVRAIGLLDRSVSRSLWPYTDYFPLSGLAPQRFLLARLLAARGRHESAERWLRSFSNSWAVGDVLFAARVRGQTRLLSQNHGQRLSGIASRIR